MDIANLAGTASNLPGMGSRVYVIELDFIDTYGAFKTPIVAPGDNKIITGDHVPLTGKGFRVWETEDDVSNFAIPITGSRSSLGLKPEVNIYIPGLSADLLWTMDQNKKYMVLLEAYGCNALQKLQIGDACNPARLTPSDGFKSGTSGGNDPRGVMLKIAANYSAWIYEGDVTLYP